MSPENETAARVASRNGGNDYNKVTTTERPFDRLNVELIMQQFERGELNPRLLRFLAETAVGLLP
jgi:hypothetical protein